MTAKYQMTPIDNGTRIRNQPNTAGEVLSSVNAGIPVTGSNLFTATSPLSNAKGVYQQVGDKWLEVTYNGITGWMAYIHMGGFICKDFKELTPPEPTVPIPPFKLDVEWTGEELLVFVDGEEYAKKSS